MSECNKRGNVHSSALGIHVARIVVYRSTMDFAHSNFATSPAADEPLRWGRVLTLALVLTVAAVSAALLVDAERLSQAIQATAAIVIAAVAVIAPV